MQDPALVDTHHCTVSAAGRKEFGGGGGNRTRVRMASNGRVYVRSPRPDSGYGSREVPENRAPISTSISPPDTAEKRSEASPLMTPATR